MFFLTATGRARYERNRHKALSLVRTRGAESLDYVRAQIDAVANEPRNRAHWRRIERHVRAVLASGQT